MNLNIMQLRNVKLHGNGCTFSQTKQLPKQGKENSSKSSYQNTPLTPYEEKIKRRKRTISRAINKFASIKSEATLSITLVVPRTQCVFESIEEEKGYFNKFLRYVKQSYPSSWFIYKFEWAPIAHIHVHLIGSLGTDDDTSAKHEQKLRCFWNKANEGSLGSNAYHQVPYIENAHFGYLVKPSKSHRDIVCQGILNGRRMFGYFNQKNIEFYEELEFELTEREFRYFFQLCKKYFRENTTSDYIEKISDYTKGVINFIPRERLLSFIIRAQAKYRKEFRHE